MSELRSIPLGQLVPSIHNTRTIRTDDPATRELAESIRASGLLQPVVCRPIGVDQFELLAGRRRYEAHKLIEAETILAIVRDLDDQQAIEVTVLENLQREDLTPIEESRAVRELLVAGCLAGEVADKMGKSVAWVTRRARLSQLSPDWLAILGDVGKDDGEQRKKVCDQLRGLGATVLELIASLPNSVQDKLLTYYMRNHWEVTQGITLGSCRRVLRSWTQNLADAPWDLKDTSFGPVCCHDCPNRSDREPDLFGDAGDSDEDSVSCLDENCFQRRRTAYYAAIKEKAERKLKQRVLTIGSGYGQDKASCDYTNWQVEEAEKDEPGAVPAIPTFGENAGQVIWVKLPDAQSGRDEPEEKREESLRSKRIGHMVSAVNEWLEQQPTCPPALCDPMRMLIVVIGIGCDLYDLEGIYDDPATFDELAEKGEQAVEFWNKVWSGLKEDLQLYHHAGSDDESCDKSEQKLDMTLHVLGLDKQDFIDKAELAFPDEKPKAKRKHVKGEDPDCSACYDARHNADCNCLKCCVNCEEKCGHEQICRKDDPLTEPKKTTKKGKRS